MKQTHFRACNLCEAICGIAIDVEDDRILSIRGDQEDPFSRGHICPKAVALQDVHHDKDRVRRPLRRRGADFEEISWGAALEETSARIAEIQKQHGRQAVGLFQGNPSVHNYGTLIYAQVFARSLRTRNRFSATSVDQLPHMLASYLMFGHQLLFPVPDVDRTSHLLMLGANPLASNGSMMTAPGIADRLKALRARGGRLVVVDPRRTETAKVADQHVPIRPGTDALFLMAFVETLFTEKLVKPGRLSDFSDGFDSLERAAKDFAPERVEARTGIAAGEIRRLAREFAASPSATCYGRVGVSTQEFGGLACWLINAINVLTGNLDRAGGAMFPLPAVDLVALAARAGQRGHFDKSRSRVRGLPEFGGEWPASALAEEIETPGDGRIRALVTSAGNPVLSTPNGARLDRALRSLEFMASIDIYVNETTRHAHVILPPTFALEHDNYDLAFHALAVRNTAKYTQPLFAPEAGARHDWQIYLDLAGRIEKKTGRATFASRLTRAALAALAPRGLLALLLRFGPHGAGWNPFGRGLTLAKLRDNPHGVDLGPLQECLPRRLYTKDRRIRLAPERFVDDVARLARALEPTRGTSLLLIGRRELRSNNSWMHNSERLVKGRDRCTLLIHPEDAAARRLTAGQKARITSRVGSVEAPVEPSDEMMPGVCSLPHGFGHAREGVRLSVAQAHAGVSLNDLTDDASIDALAGTASLNGVPVDVVPA